jgi:hypothetical protein
MPSHIHELEGFWDRVNFASAVIARNGEPTRNFDTCFEMYDGDAVAAAVVRRAKANPDGPLARNLFPRYLGPLAIESYETTKHLSRKQLEQYAADLRTEAIRARDAWWAAERAAGRLVPQPQEQA